jgi:hypothetical protein
MSEMLEKVAADMWNAAHWMPVMPLWAHEYAWSDKWAPEHEGFRELFRAQARAAVEALREPSEGMVRAGARECGPLDYRYGSAEGAAEGAFTAMIDHILKEG